MRNPIKPLAEYQELPVLTPRYREPYLSYLNYLDRNLELLNRMLERHSQVLFFRMDLRFPDRILWYNEKELFSRFLDQYRRLLASRELIRNTLFAWSGRREFTATFIWCFCSTATRPAMRIITSRRLIAYGKRFWMNPKVAWSIFAIVTGKASHIRKESESFGHRSTVTFRCTATLEYQEAFRIMSYLAKYDENYYIPENERKVFYSLCNR
ncbi:MAG: hypothetical protein V8T86_13680 [Victivallis sp.]